MIINDETWNEIIAETMAGIERINARATELGADDKFNWSLETGASGVVLLATQEVSGGYTTDRHVVVRHPDTGQTYIGRFGTVGGRRDKRLVVKWGQQDTKAWAAMAGKSAKEIIRKARLLDYVIITSIVTKATRVTLNEVTDDPVSASATTWGTTFAGKRYSSEEWEAVEALARERGVSLDQAVADFNARAAK